MGILALAAAYAASGRVGLSLATVQQNATLIWPPSGIALAALLLFGTRLWPGVALGAAVVNFGIGSPLLTALMLAAGNTLGAVVGATVLRGPLGLENSLGRVRDVVAFLVVGVVGSTLISPTIAVLTLHWTGQLGAAGAGVVWRDWWLGDATGVLVVGPALLIGLRGRPGWGDLLRRGENWAIWGAVLVTTGLTWRAVLPDPWDMAAVLAPMPMLVWAGVRLGPRGAMVASLLAVAVAIAGTATGVGPLSDAPLVVQVVFLWAYVSVVAGIALILAAAISEREEAERRRLEQEQAVHALKTKLIEAQRLEGLGTLAGGVAHDFNNILAIIRGNNDLLRGHVTASVATETLLAEVDAATLRAAELCRQMLVYAGQGQGPPAPVALDLLVADLRPLMAASVSKHVVLRNRSDDNLPGVLGDEALLRQLLMNLVVNGAEAIGDQTGQVDIRLTSAGTWVVLEVEDNGVGMDESTRERMFTPFFTTKFAGRGLGLASAEGVVRICGGTIEARSQLGEGTVIRVLLPATARPPKPADPTPPQASTSPATPPSALSAPQPVPGTVLVVEDEPDVRMMIQRMLERNGYAVDTARDGLEGIERAIALGDDLLAVVMDLTMPRMGGLEALSLLRQAGVTVPVLVTSGYADAALPDELNASFLEKPFALSALCETINALVQQPPGPTASMNGRI